MKNQKQIDIYRKAKSDLELKGEIDYDLLTKEYKLEPKDLSKGVHVRLMLDGTVMFIDPDDDYLWEEVDQAYQDYKEGGKK